MPPRSHRVLHGIRTTVVVGLVFCVAVFELSRGLTLTSRMTDHNHHHYPLEPSVSCDRQTQSGPPSSLLQKSPPPPPPPPQQQQQPAAAAEAPSFPVEFIPHANLTSRDFFAAAWWQTVPRFLDCNIDLIKNVEGDAFIPIRRAGRGTADVRMTHDWLDFSLEHLSRWWKVLGPEGVPYTVGKLQAYTQAACRRRGKSSTWMNTTLAIIPMGVGQNPKLQSKMLWKISLQATVASLLQHGVARIVLVGHYQSDRENAAAVYDFLANFCVGTNNGPLQQTTTPTSPSKYFSKSLGDSTTLVYWHAENVTSTFVAENIPKGALTDLHGALHREKSDKARQQLLGDDDDGRIKYIYMTESDQILHARLSATMLQELDKGSIMVPHRLQPIPHALDVGGVLESPERHLPPDMFPETSVLELAYETGSCCDTKQHLFLSPSDSRKPDCGDVWWRCPFRERNNPPPAVRYKQLSGYNFMRLAHGTNIVLLAGDEWSRKCIPSQQRGCHNAVD